MDERELLDRIQALETLVESVSVRDARRNTFRRSKTVQQASVSVSSSSSTFCPIVFLDSAVSIDSGTGAVSWTTEDLSGSIPVDASVALFLVKFSRVDETAERSIEFRKESGAEEYQAAWAPGLVNAADEDSHGTAQFFVPITSAKTCDYRVVQGWDNGWSIDLIGYCPCISVPSYSFSGVGSGGASGTDGGTGSTGSSGGTGTGLGTGGMTPEGTKL